MRLLSRILGTWLLGLALILIVVDGTKSLAANAVVMTPLEEIWGLLNSASIEAVRSFFASRFFGDLLRPGFEAMLAYPAFAVIGIPGLLLALAGRSRYPRRFIQQDRI